MIKSAYPIQHSLQLITVPLTTYEYQDRLIFCIISFWCPWLLDFNGGSQVSHASLVPKTICWSSYLVVWLLFSSPNQHLKSTLIIGSHCNPICEHFSIWQQLPLLHDPKDNHKQCINMAMLYFSCKPWLEDSGTLAVIHTFIPAISGSLPSQHFEQGKDIFCC